MYFVLMGMHKTVVEIHKLLLFIQPCATVFNIVCLCRTKVKNQSAAPTSVDSKHNS